MVFVSYLSLVNQSIRTLESIPMDMNEQDTIHYWVASHIRLAQIYWKEGQLQWALQSIAEGLADPGDTELLEMKSGLERALQTIQKETEQ
jgi:hypothetical protein